MESKKGEIIAVVGAPSIGKSTFVRYLRDNYRVKTFLEGEENNWPDYIKDSIAQNRNRLHITLYFHNRNIGQYIEALKLKEDSQQVVLDTFWLTNLFFLDDRIYQKPEEQELVRDLIQLTNRSFSLPDKVVFLEADNKLIKERCLGRGRSFEKNVLENFYRVNDLHKDFFDNYVNLELPSSEIIRVDAATMDYDQLAQSMGLLKK
ncbi:hypothetical protein C4566_02710 [Candidatus Parcubacteria bacterium]|nr:MAG: hypothetical protein C4566_02710 [Candidatus Parcubacteria bacterium]